jgi:hypothetical protein
MTAEWGDAWIVLGLCPACFLCGMCCAEVCFGSNRTSTNFLESSMKLLSSKQIILSFG